MKPPPSCLSPVWTLLVFSAVMKVSYAECASCSNSNVFNTTTTTATLLRMPTCSLAAGDTAGNGSLTNLTPGTTYTIYLFCSACCQNVTTRPAAVQNLSVTTVTTSSISLTWMEPQGAVSKSKVQWTDGIRAVVPRETTNHSFELNDLAPGTEYNISVRAVAQDGLTEGDMVTALQYTRPNRVENLTVMEVTTSSIQVGWSEPLRGSWIYKVEWTDGNMTDTYATSINISSLSPGAQHVISVTAVAPDGHTMGASDNVSQYTRPGKIQNSTVSSNTTSIWLSWSPPAGQVGNYRIAWHNGGEPLIRYTTEESAVLSHLTPGVEYTITLVSIAQDNETEGESITFYQFTRPGKVSDILVVGGTSDISVMWTPASGGVDHYDVSLRRDSQLINMSRIHNTTGARFEGLTPGVLYCVEVVTRTANLSSSSSSVCNATVPKPPGPISVESQTVDSINFTWTDPDDMDHDQFNFSVSSINGSFITKNNWFLLDELQPGTFYTISVLTLGLLEYKSTAVTVGGFTRPEKPVEVTVTPATESLNISWVLRAGRVDRYVLNVSNEDLMYSHSIRATFTTAHVPGLHPGRVYNVTVTSIAGDLSTSSDVYSFATVPNPPGSIIISERSNSSLYLQWATPSMMAGAPSISYLISYQTSSWDAQTYSSTNSSVLVLLSSGTSYNITVRTVGPQNLTSSGISVTSFTIPNPVLNLKARPSNTTSVTVEWSDPQGVQEYYYYLITTRTLNGTIQSSLVVSDNRADVHGLEPGTRYRITVATVAVAGSESEAEQTDVYTEPKPVTGLREEHVNASVIKLTWIRQSDHKSFYSYLVIMFLDEESILNVTTRTETHTFYQLIPGKQYNFDVYTVVGGVRSNVTSASVHTKPGKVTNITLIGTTTDMLVSWSRASGRVDSYSVLYKRGMEPVYRSSNISVTSANATLVGLTPGVLYCAVVVTQASHLETESDPVCNATFPNPPGPITMDSQTVSSVNFTWTDPNEMIYDNYNFSVSTFRGSFTTLNNWFLLSDLQAGTPYSVSVATVGLLAYESTVVTAQNWTLPHSVHPQICSEGSNRSVMVSWNAPPGAVESYVVTLNGSSIQRTTILPNNTDRQLFEYLSAGTRYTAMVTTHSGPGTASSEPVTNATFPNPPGPIEILMKTTGSLQVQWAEPLLMENGQFNYSVEIFPSENDFPIYTSNNGYTFSSLVSGTTYDITVITVGVMNFKSDPVIYPATTRPKSVKSPSLSPEEDKLKVMWNQPDEYKISYFYNLTWQSSDKLGNINVENTESTIDDLVPGDNYTITITTVTKDGTESLPKRIHGCTDASPVNNLHVESPDTENAAIHVSWSKPRGYHQGFKLSIPEQNISQTSGRCDQICNLTIPNLAHYTKYDLTLETLGCGRPSKPVKFSATTGITEPTISENFESLVVTNEKEYNQFSVVICPNLLVSNKGPITNIGVLVANSPAGSTDMKNYLGKTYKDWQDKKTPAYLAVVSEISLSRSKQEIIVGDESKWQGYKNGLLSGGGRYQYAIALFTKLILDDGLVDASSSLVSITDFYPEIQLPHDPQLLGLAIGVPMAIFCILFIVLIGFIVYWRRLATKESSDIQIHTMGAKVSAAVRVEDFEAYYKKQKADSNCGFAEEYEDLKDVGTGLAKLNAVIQENRSKNRYINVLPYDSSRVKLSMSGNPCDDYINANYVPGYHSRNEFIAAQGPLPGTVNDFWRMIWEKNVQTVVMLTGCVERGKVKCEQYWTEDTKHYGNITVTKTSEIPLDDWTIREFDIKNIKTAETRTISHLHFTAWPDHGVPDTTELLISFRHLVREHMDQYSKYSPTVVHCSAGVGRTGTFICIDRLVFQIERENIVDIYGTVYDMRLHRPLMVQTEAQYVFLNQCALDIIKSRTGTNVDLIYQNVAAFSIYQNLEMKRLK